MSTALQEPDWAKQGGTSDKAAAADKTSAVARAGVQRRCRKTRGTIEDEAGAMADEDGFILEWLRNGSEKRLR